MAKNEKTKNDYRSERKERIAKAAKKSNKKHDSVAVARGVLIALLVVVVLACFAGGLYVYGIPQRLTPAMKVGDRTYSVAEYNYYYASVYQTYAYQSQSYKEQYGISIGFDAAKDPAAQTTKQDDKDISYDEFFRNYVKETLETTNYYLKLAKSEGMEISEESKNSIDSTINEIKTAAEGNYSVDRYISLLYGKGLNEKILRNILNEQALVSQYREKEEHKLSDSITMEEIEKKYNENPADFQRVDIRLFGIEVKSDDAKTETKTEASDKDDQKPSREEVIAKEMLAKITDEASFAKLSKEYASEEDKEKFDDDSATVLKAVQKATVSDNIDKELAEWLYSTERKVGDKTTCSTDKYVYVILVTKPVYRIETPLASARHILISFDNIKNEMEKAGEILTSDKDSEVASDGKTINKSEKYTLPVILKAYEKAKSLLDTYNNGEKTEEAFAKLADENSADTASTSATDDGTTGGLYEDIEIGKMVAPFENWVYNSERKPGDVDIIETTYGWHVMYFVSKHEEAEWIETIRHSIVDEKISATDETIKAETKDTATTTAFTSIAGKNALNFVNTNYVPRYATTE